MVTLGILYVYLIGPFVTYFTLNVCCLAVPIVFAVLFLIVAPETPLYLLRKNKRYTYLYITQLDSHRSLSEFGERKGKKMSILYSPNIESRASHASFFFSSRL